MFDLYKIFSIHTYKINFYHYRRRGGGRGWGNEKFENVLAKDEGIEKLTLFSPRCKLET